MPRRPFEMETLMQFGRRRYGTNDIFEAAETVANVRISDTRRRDETSR
jgi:hypothetical protein